MLTARGEEGDRVRGLDSGADDYVVKPFSPSELVARLRAVIRRVRPAPAAEMLRFADIAMDLVGASRDARRRGRSISARPSSACCAFSCEHPGRVFSREQLLDAVWGHDVEVELRTVDVHIRRLRKALNDGDRPDLIRTVRAAGYALDTVPA